MIYFKTSNPHKFDEAKEIFKRYGIELEQIPETYREIQADSLEEVVKDALKTIENIGRGVFIEDAGLFIKALNGFPGVYSSYIENTIGNDGILKLMEDVDDRSAVFMSVVGFKGFKGFKDFDAMIFKGEVKGEIAFESRGTEGFGYDPIFIPEGYKKTFAEDFELKTRISHRRRAIEKLARFINPFINPR